MKIFGASISQHFGFFFIVIIAWSLTNNIKLYWKTEYGPLIIAYLLLYLLGLWILDSIEKLALEKSLEKKYSLSILLTLFIFIFDIEKNIKFLKINFILKNSNKVEDIQKYFNDKNEQIQYISLLLYANNVDKQPVLYWFEDKYIRNNLPIESNFFPIYEFCNQQ